MELLFQQPGLSEEQSAPLKSVYQAANRLSKLHNTLSLLTRIENLEFTERKNVNLKALLTNLFENFSDIIVQKNLKTNLSFKEDVIIDGNYYLMEILISNLVSNAIKHNITSGWINAELNSKYFRISNSGITPGFPPETFFERFRKGKKESDSTGLGLTLCKEFVEKNGGKIWVESEPGKGSSFYFTLPFSRK